MSENELNPSKQSIPAKLNEFGMHDLKRKPVSVGEILKDMYLDEMNISIEDFAKSIKVSSGSLQSLIDGKTKLSVPMAFKIAKRFGQTVHMWLNMQREYDTQVFIQNPNNKAIIDSIEKMLLEDLISEDDMTLLEEKEIIKEDC